MREQEQPTHIVKKIGNTVYHVKFSFSTFLPPKTNTTTMDSVAPAEAEKTLVDTQRNETSYNNIEFNMNKTMKAVSSASTLARNTLLLMLIIIR